ncbi:MAG: hypothetical protein ACODAJ_04310, partial [Planctomycetota bacterium]
MKSLLLILCLSTVAAEPTSPEKGLDSAKPATSEKHAYAPTSDYAVKDIEGWKVYVHKPLLTEKKALSEETLKVLAMHLHHVRRMVPKGALAKLRRVPLWVEQNPKVACACYHPSRGWLEG